MLTLAGPDLLARTEGGQLQILAMSGHLVRRRR